MYTYIYDACAFYIEIYFAHNVFLYSFHYDFAIIIYIMFLHICRVTCYFYEYSVITILSM